MRIVICVYAFPPYIGGGYSYRMATFSRHWAEAGHEVIVVCSDGDADIAVPDLGADHRLQGLVTTVVVPSPWNSTGYRCLRTLGLGTTAKRLVRLGVGPDCKVLWVRRAARRLGAFLGHNDHRDTVVVTSSAPYSVHLLGRVALRANVTWCADFRDPFTLNSRYRPVTSYHLRRDTAFEQWVYDAADLVVLNTDGNLQDVETCFDLDAGKFVVVRNGYDGSEIRPHTPESDGRFVILQLGGFNAYEAPIPNLLWSLLQTHPDRVLGRLRMVHVGNRPAEGRAARTLREAGLLDELGFLEQGAAVAALQLGHAAMLALSPSDSRLGWTPQRLYSYVGAGLPLLGLTPEGDAADIVRAAGGAVFPPDRWEDAKAHILGWLESYEAGAWPPAGCRSAKVARRYDNRTLAKRWTSHLAAAVRTRGGTPGGEG